MPTIDAAHAFELEFARAKTRAELADLLREACAFMGCAWFALSHHLDFLAAPDKGVRVHNYPEEWAYWFDQNRLGPSDPVHRASQRSRAGFLWHDMRRYDAPRPGDETILAEAERHGIGDGLTVPAHIPGDAHGSVSFAWRPGCAAEPDALQFARMIGGAAFEAADSKVLLHCTVAWRASHLWAAYLVKHKGYTLEEAKRHGAAMNLNGYSAGTPLDGLLGTSTKPDGN